MVKRISLLMFALGLLLVNSQVLALSLEKNNVNIVSGEQKKIKLYADLPEDTEKVEFVLVFDSYDIPVYFSPTTGITDENPNGIKHKLILDKASSGNVLLGSIIARVVTSPNILGAGADIHSAVAYDSLGNSTPLTAQKLTVTIGKDTNDIEDNNGNNSNEDNKKTYNLLKEIKNGDEVITVFDDVFEYDLNILSSVTMLDLEVIPKNSKYNVEISSQVVSELEDNKVKITVTNGKEKQDYFINVKIIKEIPKVEIDNSEFETNNSYKGLWIIVMIVSGVGLFFGVVLNKIKK